MSMYSRGVNIEWINLRGKCGAQDQQKQSAITTKCSICAFKSTVAFIVPLYKVLPNSKTILKTKSFGVSMAKMKAQGS